MVAGKGLLRRCLLDALSRKLCVAISLIVDQAPRKRSSLLRCSYRARARKLCVAISLIVDQAPRKQSAPLFCSCSYRAEEQGYGAQQWYETRRNTCTETDLICKILDTRSNRSHKDSFLSAKNHRDSSLSNKNHSFHPSSPLLLPSLLLSWCDDHPRRKQSEASLPLLDL